MKIHTIPLSMGQVYLIPCPAGYMQVDTGYDRDFPAYRKGLKKAGIRLTEVKYLFLTHHHDDHAGFLNDLVQASSSVIIASRLSKPLLLTGENDRSHGGGWVSPLIRALAETKMRLDPNWTLTFPPFALRKQDILVDGDDYQTLRSIGIDGQILRTPGHCLDHQALVLNSGEVFYGDVAASMLLFAGARYCPVFMTDMEAAYQSWQKMLDAGARMIYPTHGRPFAADRLKEQMGKIKTSDLIPLNEAGQKSS